MKKPLGSKFVLFAIILVSLMGGLLVAINTQDGPWGYSDPVVFLSTARSLAGGQGFGYYEADAEFTYLTIQPPFYSMVLSLPAFFKIDLVASARWINIFAFVASIFISGWIFYRYGSVPVLGVIASVLLCIFPHMLVMFTSAYTEPLFILLFLSGGLCLLIFIKSRSIWAFLGSALLLGLTAVTRYVGVAVILSAACCIGIFLVDGFWSWTKKILLFLLVSGLPIVIWFLWVFFVDDHTVGGRNLVTSWEVLGVEFGNFRGLFMDIIWRWLPFQSVDTSLRYRTRFILLGLSSIFIIGLTFTAGRSGWADKLTGKSKYDYFLFTFFGLSTLFLLSVILATYLFTLPTIDIDNRILLPIFVSGVMCFYGAFGIWQSRWFNNRLTILRTIPWVLLLMSVIWYFPQAKERMEFVDNHRGLTSYKWNSSQVVQDVRDFPLDRAVISNEWELLLLWTGRPIHSFWKTFPTDPPLHFDTYGSRSQIDPVQVLFCNQDAALVIFNSIPDSI